MKEEISRKNLPDLLLVFFEASNVSKKDVAKSIGCPIASLERIIFKETLASDEMLKQCGVLFSIGYDKYKKLTKAEKEKLSESIGAVGGGVLGFGGITAAISASGIAGLSAAGITSGLAAIGSIIGGGMIAGATIVAAIPIAAGAAGYGVVKGIKSIINANKINNTDFNPIWEIKK